VNMRSPKIHTRYSCPPAVQGHSGKRRPRVAIVYHFFPHYRKGVFDAIQHLDVDLTYFADPVERYQGIPSLNFGADRDFRPASVSALKSVSFQWRAVAAAMSPEFDVLVLLANPNFLTTWLAALAGRLTGKRVLFWGHGFLSAKRSIKNYVRKLFFSLAHGQYLYGYRAKCIAQEFGFRARNLYVGFNSLDYQLQLEARRRLLHNWKLCGPTGEVELLGVSRLTDRCEYDLLLMAVSVAERESGRKFHLTLIGGGPAEKRLRNLAAELEIKVTFVGELYDENAVARYIFEADAVVSPGKVGLTAMHALMFGTPVISHSDMDRQMPEAEAIVHGISGMLFEYADLQGLADCLISIPDVFPDRNVAREQCFRVVDEIYNPRKQCEVLADAIYGHPARKGDDMLCLYGPAYD
jgi:glycosyltransferase involved in cell wall biosynthesis